MNWKLLAIMLLLHLVPSAFPGVPSAVSAPEGDADLPAQIRGEIWALTSRDDLEEARSAFKLRGMKDALLAVPYLIGILDHDSPVEFRWATKERNEGNDAPDFILKTTAGHEAKETILKIGRPAAGPLIDALQKRTERARVRAIIASMLPLFRDPNAVEPLISALQDADAGVREQSATALGAMGDLRAVEPLIAALRDPDLPVRSVAQNALAKLDISQAVAKRVMALKEKDAGKRLAATNGLGEIGSPAAVEPLVERLKDNDSYVRAGAASALGKIRDARAVEPLIALLDDVFMRVQLAAVSALGDLRDSHAVEPLAAKLTDKNMAVAKSAAESLGKIGEAHAVEPLVDLLRDPSPTRDGRELQKEAIKALQTITKQRFLNNREEWITWWEKARK